MSVICKIDGKEFKDEKSLHLALKGYGLNKVKYYQKYFERRDLLTNELINFKTKEQYLNNDFNDKNNMKKWLKQQPLDYLITRTHRKHRGGNKLCSLLGGRE